MSGNDVYLLLVDEIFDILKEKNPKTSNEAFEIIESIRYEIEDIISHAMDDIFDDYCKEKNLKWEDDE